MPPDARFMTRTQFQAYVDAENVDLAERRAERLSYEADRFITGKPWLPLPQPLPRCPICWAHQRTLTVHRDEPNRIDFQTCGHVVHVVEDPRPRTPMLRSDLCDLTVIVPTRGRPQNLAELWRAFVATCTANTRLLAVVDDDDPELPAYQAMHEDAYEQGLASRADPRFLLLIGPRLRLGGTLNAVAPYQATRSAAVGFMGDDHRPRSVGWDGRYVAELDRLGTGLAYGNDLIQGPNLPTQVAMTSDIILATGHMVPPGLVHLWADNAWLALGQALEAITYLPDVIVEHCHPIAGRAEWDAGYAEANDDARSDADRAVFEAWRANDLDRWAQQIKEYPRG